VSGTRRLTLEHVARLARALDVDTDALLVRRRGGADAERLPQTRDGKTWWALTDESTRGRRAYRVRIPPELREPVLRTHEGHQWIYVLRGRLRVVLERREALMAPGEAIQFSTWLPHWIGAVDEAVELLVIFGPDGTALQVASGTPTEAASS
jgi:quercetin dioxygenase-like cupin family protein